MLTREHAIADYKEGRVFPDRLTRKSHHQYLKFAEQMCDVYRYGVGRTRQSLHREIEKIFDDEPNCPPRRVASFCKLLDEWSEYQRDEKGMAAKLRREVFRTAASYHPLVREADPMFEFQEDQAKREIATLLNRDWPEIDSMLFADILEFHTLKSFQVSHSAIELLARYNVAQVQVALYDAVSMTIFAQKDYRSILRYAKLSRLMHRIQATPGGGYRFDLDGPASLLSSTHRYGVSMAKFLPGLLSCRGWRMKAILKPSRWSGRLTLELDAESGLSSPVPKEDDFDSQIERNFFNKWGNDPRNGWRLERESEILHAGQRVFFPDFVFRHEDGRVAFMEVVGFWTPEYLAHKRETLELFSRHRILLAVAHSQQDLIQCDPANLIVYKTAIKLEDVLAKLWPAP